MGFPQRYDAAAAEQRWQQFWADERIYAFDPASERPIFAIDTPPPTVSGAIHIGHVYSYTQAETMARFWRMRGYNVYYPFGFDDNGLPTERFVEKERHIRAHAMARADFIATCLEVSQTVEDRFEAFWRRLGFSVDWRLRYSSIDPQARHIAQWSFLDLYRKGKIYRAQRPNPWCVECRTAIAQAEIDDIERETQFYTLAFGLPAGPAADGSPFLPIATTRPELLPACVAVFVHPDDPRFGGLIGGRAQVPLSDRTVPILADALVDPQKGSGAVMCCTFGDSTDVTWQQSHKLPLIELVAPDGMLSAAGGAYAGLRLSAARRQIVADLEAAGLLRETWPATQAVRVHERCGTPLEIRATSQWFVRLLDDKETWLAAGRQITWHPAHMQTRYEHWVRNLNLDWCISRQRFYGVPFPAWHCDQCGAVVLADEAQLPVDPTSDAPPQACPCGHSDLRPDPDVMDTWATSALSPQIAAQMFANPALYKRLFPMQLRPQAHDIIRTWAFYTIVKSHYHFGQIPWQTIMISGHALDPAGGKFSKSKGNAQTTPEQLIAKYSADGVRYWACGGSIGADQFVNEETMRQGSRLVNKLWNAARLIAAHVNGDLPQTAPELTPSDRALLSWLQRLVLQVTAQYAAYDYAGARDATERFFWDVFCDHYLEWVKNRLYDGSGTERAAARYTLNRALLTLLKLFAPLLPHITEEIHGRLYAEQTGERSIHATAWPQADDTLLDADAERAGEALIALTGAVRRYKSARQLSLGAALDSIELAVADNALGSLLAAADADIRSVTRTQQISWQAAAGDGYVPLTAEVALRL